MRVLTETHSIEADVVKEQPHLGMIFEKDVGGKYTNDALLYQDILQYALVRDGSYASREPGFFVFDELAGWLVMKKNQEFLNDYQDFASRTPKYHRINAKRRKIQKRIDNLLSMVLLVDVERVKARRNNQVTTLYAFSRGAKVIAWIIRSQLPEIAMDKRNFAYEQVYKSVQSLFPSTDGLSDHQAMSKNLFKFKFLEKCWKNGIFDQVVNTMADILHHNGSKIRFITDVLEYIIYDFVRFTHKRLKTRIWKTFKETLDDLDETSRRVIMYYDKLVIERRIHAGNAGSYSEFANREWEEKWFANRNEYSKLVLLGHCSKCKFSGPCIVDYYKFKEKAFLDEKEGMYLFKSDCSKCNAIDKLLLTT